MLKKILSNNYIISFLILSSTLLWFIYSTPEKTVNTSILNNLNNETTPFNVRTKNIKVDYFEYYKNFNGRTEAVKIFPVYTREEGIVENLKVKNGQFITEEQKILKINSESLQKEFLFFENNLKEKQRIFENNKRLFKNGFTNEDNLIKSETDFIKSQSDLNFIVEKIKNTEIKAPSSGYIFNLDLEEGFFVQKNTKLFEIHDLSKIKINIFIPEKYINMINKGQKASVFINNKEYSGKVDFISNIASDNTLTFRVEVLLDNKKQNIFSGLSSSVRVHFEPVKGFKISPYILTIENELLGIKIVNKESKVEFYPVQIIKTFEDNEVLVSGNLPENIDLIILGQEYVKIGEVVK